MAAFGDVDKGPGASMQLNPPSAPNSPVKGSSNGLVFDSGASALLNPPSAPNSPVKESNHALVVDSDSDESTDDYCGVGGQSTGESPKKRGVSWIQLDLKPDNSGAGIVKAEQEPDCKLEALFGFSKLLLEDWACSGTK